VIGSGPCDAGRGVGQCDGGKSRTRRVVAIAGIFSNGVQFPGLHNVGLFITIGFSYFFGLDTFPSQALRCGIFSSLLGLTILAILELAHPYRGSVVISDAPFRFVITQIGEMDRMALSRAGRSEAVRFVGNPVFQERNAVNTGNLRVTRY